jgi:hypothetical protein
LKIVFLYINFFPFGRDMGLNSGLGFMFTKQMIY